MNKNEQIIMLNNFFTTGYTTMVNIARTIQNGVRGSINTRNSKSESGVNNIIWQNDYKDSIHNCYLKVLERINSGKLEHTENIKGYTLITLKHEIIDRHNEDAKRDYANLSEVQIEAEQILIDKEQSIESTAKYLDEIRHISKEIFQYLDQRYTDKQLSVFKIYFLNNKMTYRKVSKLTNYSIGFVSETIKIIKKDLKENLINYINNKT